MPERFIIGNGYIYDQKQGAPIVTTFNPDTEPWVCAALNEKDERERRQAEVIARAAGVFPIDEGTD